MDIRKSDTERAINLLELYKKQLNRQEDRSLKKAMDKLIEVMNSDLFLALLDIQEFYELTLTTSLKSPVVIPEKNVEPPPPEVEAVVPVQVKKEKSRKKRRDRSEEEQQQFEEQLPEVPVDMIQSEEQVSLQHEAEMQPYVDPWEYYEIQLSKTKGGYGFGVAGGYDRPHYEGDYSIFVTKIIEGQAAYVDGSLRLDDVLISVNGIGLENVSHDFAVNTLKNAGNSMTLVIRRIREEYIMHAQGNMEEMSQQPEELNEDVNLEQFEIVLIKKAGAGLGFSIQGGCDPNNPDQETYISISKITPGGLAEQDGNLQVGDILLMVDGRSLSGLSHEDAVQLLKSTGRQVRLYISRFTENNPPQDEEPPYVEPIEAPERTEKKKKKKHRRDRSREE